MSDLDCNSVIPVLLLLHSITKEPRKGKKVGEREGERERGVESWDSQQDDRLRVHRGRWEEEPSSQSCQKSQTNPEVSLEVSLKWVV